ncbi:MAG: DUF3108 domain-containing protein [Verrucomicrobiota bacterium]|nr:DUF3108 domain-containing protein [Verrucomicrobiota bacterium]
MPIALMTHFSLARISSVSLLLLGASIAPIAHAQTWMEGLSPISPGPFPEPRPVRVKYAFGWGGVNAATAELVFSRNGDHLQLEGTGQTVGLARTLWKFDVHQISTSDAHTLRPLRVKEIENARAKQFDTELAFTPERVSSHRIEQRNGSTKTKSRTFDFPNVQSLSSALLYLRSKPLNEGEAERIVVYPSTNPYLCTVTVLGHEHVTVPTGAYDAIKLDVKLSKVGKDRELIPHKKFKRATVWLSNDPERLILRIEAQVFLGTVSAELQSVQFENAKP